jgi:hypothetical protein
MAPGVEETAAKSRDRQMTMLARGVNFDAKLMPDTVQSATQAWGNQAPTVYRHPSISEF